MTPTFEENRAAATYKKMQALKIEINIRTFAKYLDRAPVMADILYRNCTLAGLDTMTTNTIYCESCMDTMAGMTNGSVDLIVTSPPYNMRTRIRNGKYTTREKSERFSKKYKEFGDDLSIEDFYIFHSDALKEMLRVSKVVLYNIQIVTGSKEAFFKIIGGFSRYIKDVIVWDKGAGQPAMHTSVMNACHELILVMESSGTAGRAIENSNFARGAMPNLWKVQSRGRHQSDGHSAAFPLSLAERAISAFSKEGDLVYDPFGGTGTTAIAAHRLGRRWMMSEIVPEYAMLAEDRIAPFLMNKSLFD